MIQHKLIKIKCLAALHLTLTEITLTLAQHMELLHNILPALITTIKILLQYFACINNYYKETARVCFKNKSKPLFCFFAYYADFF